MDDSQDTMQIPGSTPAQAGFELDDTWVEEVTPPPRRRLLTPLTAGLLAALLLGVGVFAGIQIQKHYAPSSRSGVPSGLAAAFGGGAPASTSGGRKGASGGQGAFANRGNLVTGQVAFIKGSTLYVTDQSGATVKVTTKPTTSVSKTSTVKPKAIHPGDTVVVVGSKAKSGAVAATSITIGSGSLPGLGSGGFPGSTGSSGAGSGFGGGGSGAGNSGAGTGFGG
jgi:hypothetical protein